MARRTSTMIARRKKTFTLPLAVVAGFSMPVFRTLDAVKDGDWRSGVGEFVRDMTGYQPWVGGWNWNHLKLGLFPVIAGVGIHKLASALGINRMLANSGIPVVRI